MIVMVLLFNNREAFLASLNSYETVTFFEVRSLYPLVGWCIPRSDKGVNCYRMAESHKELSNRAEKCASASATGAVEGIDSPSLRP